MCSTIKFAPYLRCPRKVYFTYGYEQWDSEGTIERPDRIRAKIDHVVTKSSTQKHIVGGMLVGIYTGAKAIPERRLVIG